MAAPGFLNENVNRAFPFLKGAVGVQGASGTIEALPNAAIADAGFLMGLDSGYVAGVHSVQLASVTRLDSLFTFTFISDAPGLSGYPLVFTRELTDPDYAVEDVEVADTVSYPSDSLYTSDIPFDEEVLWSGYLVSGLMAKLSLAIPANTTITPGSDAGGIIEPALVQSLVAGNVFALNIANQDRTRVTARDGCPAVTWPFTPGGVFVAGRGLQGNIRFQPGFNCAIRQDSFENAIIIGAAKGAGDGEPCNEVPLFPGEAPPAGSALLTGGPRCNQVVRTINGSGGQFASLIAGLGVQMQLVPEENTIILDINMSQLAICYSDSITVSESA